MAKKFIITQIIIIIILLTSCKTEKHKLEKMNRIDKKQGLVNFFKTISVKVSATSQLKDKNIGNGNGHSIKIEFNKKVKIEGFICSKFCFPGISLKYR